MVIVKVKVLCNSTMLEELYRQKRIVSSETSSSNEYISPLHGATTRSIQITPEIRVSTSTSPSCEKHGKSSSQRKEGEVSSRKKFTKTKKTGDVWSPDYVQFIIDYWEVSPGVASSLREIKKRLSDISHPMNRPDILIRFVIHCREDVVAADALFRQMLKWRKQNQVDEMFSENNPYTPDPLLLRYYPGAILAGKGDHQGDPIFLSRMGVTDLNGLLARFSHDQMIQFEIWKREAGCTGHWIRQWEEHNKRPIKRIVIIEDMYGLSRRQLVSSRVLQLYGEVMKLDQDNFCECSKKIIVIRAPSLFRLAWTIGKRFFPQHIIDKMEFTSEGNYLEVLSEYMDINDLPSCVYSKGKGRAIPGMSTSFEGGPIPADK